MRLSRYLPSFLIHFTLTRLCFYFQFGCQQGEMRFPVYTDDSQKRKQRVFAVVVASPHTLYPVSLMVPSAKSRGLQAQLQPAVRRYGPAFRRSPLIAEWVLGFSLLTASARPGQPWARRSCRRPLGRHAGLALKWRPPSALRLKLMRNDVMIKGSRRATCSNTA